MSQIRIESVRCSRSDGIGLRKLDKVGVDYLIISTEQNPVVAMRAAKLGVSYYQGCDNKIRVLESLLTERGISWNETAFVGNDINDLECLRAAGIAVAVDDAYPEVKAVAHYKTSNRGGCGAVREVCDLIYDIKRSRFSPT